MMRAGKKLSWSEVVQSLRAAPVGSVARIPVWQIEHPLDAAMRPTVVAWVGQRADFSTDLDAATACHVADFGAHYDARLHAVATLAAPSRDPASEMPGATLLGATALGAILGAMLGGGKQGAAVGAAIGGLAGLAAVGVSNAEASPATAEAAKQMFEGLAKAMNAHAHSPTTVPAPRPALPSAPTPRWLGRSRKRTNGT